MTTPDSTELPCGCRRSAAPAGAAAAPAPVPQPEMFALDTRRIRAIALDLDDTLWPVWPTIDRAERALLAFLQRHAPQAAELSRQSGLAREVRHALLAANPHYAHDLTTLRREMIRTVLLRAGDDPELAEPAFDVFYEERQRVDFFPDALPALEFLSCRFPVVAVSNGNADVHRVGIGAHFHAAVSARSVGVGKPDARIFHAAAQAAGVAPHEVLHVGDDAHLDGLGALGAGMQLAWVNRSGEPWPHAPLRPHVEVRDLAALCALLGEFSAGS